VITSARRIFDDSGVPLGVVAIGIEFNNIAKIISDMRLVEGGGGMLADENYHILVHIDTNLISTHMKDLANGPRQFLQIMEQGEASARIEDYNYLDEYSVFYFKKLDNGWIIWIMTPKNIYYRDLKTLVLFLSVLGFTLMLAVNLILVRIDIAKRKSDKRVQLLLDVAPFGITLIDRNYKIIDCNNAALIMTGLEGRKDVYKSKFIELLSPEYQPNGERSDSLMRQYIDSVFEEHGGRLRWTYKNINGEFIPCEVTFAEIPYKEQEIAVGYMRDLREELRIQEKTREAEAAVAKMQRAVEEKNMLANMGNILNGIDTMIYVTDSVTDELLFINDNMKRHYGLEGDVTGEKCYKILQKDINERCDFCPCFKLDMEPGATVVWEENSTLTNRIYRNVDRYIDWPNGKKVHLQHSIDITDLRTMTDTLNKRLKQQSLMTSISQNFLSNEDMDALITKAFGMVGEAMGIDQILMYAAKDTEASFVCKNEWLNPKLELPTRVGEDFKISKDAYDLIKRRYKEQELIYVTSNDPDVKKAIAPYRVTFCDYILTFVFLGDKLYAAIDFAREGNDHRWEQDEINIAFYITNILVGALTRRSVELQLIAAKESAEQSNNLKGIFLANMSHEIRTPMNAILGISEIQLQDTALPPDAEEAFNQIYDSGNLLLNIINDILDFSKIEAGKLEIVPVKYDVPSLLNDTAQLNRLRFESKPVEFTLDVDENMPLELYGDELRIKQILNNLLSNAFKYTDHGKVGLSVHPEPGKDEETVTLVFRVNDTGQGMKEDQIAKLFDAYSRFNMEANRTVAGTGLGMNIVKRIVEMMNGQIFVESEIGKGSTITVRVPQKNVGQAVCGAEFVENLRNFRFRSMPISKKAQIVHEYMPYGSVLVVDDVVSNIYVIRGLLKPYGLRIETASSGIEAIEKIRAGNVYDIVFMDHMMPKMDGMEATKIIRGMGYAHTIIAFTANAIVGQSDIFLANGFDGFISKPIDSRELDAAVKSFIRDKQPHEVIEATRREQREREAENQAVSAQEINDASEVEKYVVSDAEKAITVLEEVYSKLHASDIEAINSYITAVHGMKSALANIGETKLSAAALKLEQAGNERDFAVIAEETPAFTNALRALISKLKPDNNNETTEISGDDTVYLRDKLLDIKTACEAFDITAAKNALDDLQRKAWPHHVNGSLDEISVHLLHSAFKKAADVAENAAKM
jgi:PAS domain S-box-containing protein